MQLASQMAVAIFQLNVQPTSRQISQRMPDVITHESAYAKRIIAIVTRIIIV